MKQSRRMSRTSLVLGAIALAGLVASIVGAAAWTRRHATGPGSPIGLSAVAARSSAARVGGTASDREIAKWDAATREDRTDAHAWTALGDALTQKARETADVTYYGLTERAYARALALEPRSVAALVGMAWVYGGRHQFERSIDWATKALAIDPRSAAAYGLMGDADLEIGDYDAAFRHYQSMLDIRPDVSSYSRGAHLLFLMGDLRKAAWLMQKAVASGAPYAENTAWCRAQLGLMLLANGNLVPAEQVLRDALKRTPHNYHVLAAMGRVQSARGAYAAAAESYRKALEVAPQVDTLAALGDVYARMGRKADADLQYAQVEAAQRLYRANGVLGDRQIALFYADHDRNLPQALEMVQAEYRSRRNVYCADALAWCLYKNGRYVEARDAARQALARRTPEALFLYHAGMIEAKLGNGVAAQNYLYQAVNLNPGFHPQYASAATAMLRELGSRPPEVRRLANR